MYKEKLFRKLELKNPPVVVLLFFALIAWYIQRLVPSRVIEMPQFIKLLVLALLVVISLVLLIATSYQFKKAKTTILPMNPANSSKLITSGTFKISRNPIYLAFAVTLFAWIFYQSNLASLIAFPLFILYMNRFQIIPEERALKKIFGEEFSTYKSRVRRWI